MFKLLKSIDSSFYAITIFMLFNTGYAKFANTREFVLFSFISLFALFIYKRRKFDSVIFIVLIYWFTINILSFFHNRPGELHLKTIFTRSGLYMSYYFMLKIVGKNFFDRLLKYLYPLALISLPLYAIDSSYPNLFSQFNHYFAFMTIDEQVQNGGWYSYIYTHNSWAYFPNLNLFRNSGFMWEPGGFSMMLIFLLIYRLLTNGFKWDRMTIVFVIAILTTFSTSGYIALILVFFAYQQQLAKSSYIFYILSVPLLIYLILIFAQLDFVGVKLNLFIEHLDATYTELSGRVRVNRIAIMNYNFEQSLVWPFGNGIYDSKYLIEKYRMTFSGSNTIANFLYIWGWPGLIALSFYSYRFFKLKYIRTSKIIVTIMLLAYFSVLFSNPMSLRPLIYVVAFYPIIFKNTQSAYVN